MITFTAYGVPAPKGSTKAFFRPGMRFPVVTEDNKHTRPWAAIVKDAARQEVGSVDIPYAEGPVCIHVAFYLPKPKSMPKKVQHHVKKPDCDKLLRAIFDALKGVVWTDDSQVTMESATKEYAEGGAMPRAEIRVDQLRADIASYDQLKQLGIREFGIGSLNDRVENQLIK